MSFPNLDFALGETADMIRETTRRFATDRIAPLAARIDAEDWFPRGLWPEMGALGLHGVTVDEEWGGLGLGYLEHVVAQEEVARASASVGLSYGAHSNLCVNQIHRWGNDDQRSEEHTSELQSLMRISYAVFCLKKKNNTLHTTTDHQQYKGHK